LSELHHLERAVLSVLKDGRKISLSELVAKTRLPEASVSRSLLWLSSKGYVKIEDYKRTLISLGSEGKLFLKMGFPERILVESIIKYGGRLPLEKVTIFSTRDKGEVNIALGWARRKGWLQILQEGGRTILTASNKPDKGLDEKLVEAI